MSISIYNSLSRKKEPFAPLNPPKVNIYTCGVTVYDDCHIGHARSLYIFDVIRRYLKYRGYQVNFVRNITDIDDKIINKAKEEKVGFEVITKRYIDSYYRDIRALGIEKADFEPRATENIPDMIKHIQGLIDKGSAYVVEGEVYFSVRSFRDYGKLSGQGIDQMLEAVRVEKDPKKKDPLDFALWKKSSEDEPSWDSPWGKGRPGWHIECSVMSQKFLETQNLDIHAGGRDLIFPHHENEIAQAEALTGKPFAKYWIHHGLLTIQGQKMAKSLGNFVTIQDFMNKYRDADLLKLFFLAAHYASPVDYNEEKIKEARKQKDSFVFFFNEVSNWPMLEVKNKQTLLEGDKKNKIDLICEEFNKVMDDDFNTPQALGCLFELLDFGSKLFASDQEKAFKYAADKLSEMFNIFGLKIEPTKVPDQIKQKGIERDKAKKKKDFTKADSIRQEIKKQGFATIDTATNLSMSAIPSWIEITDEDEDEKKKNK